jgi:hypothetical protein
MSKVYSAFKCEACSTVIEGECDEGAAILFAGNVRYGSIAKEKIIFEDICETCRTKLREAISSAFPHLRWATTIEAVMNPVAEHDPYREVGMSEPPSEPTSNKPEEVF